MSEVDAGHVEQGEKVAAKKKRLRAAARVVKPRWEPTSPAELREREKHEGRAQSMCQNCGWRLAYGEKFCETCIALAKDAPAQSPRVRRMNARTSAGRKEIMAYLQAEWSDLLLGRSNAEAR